MSYLDTPRLSFFGKFQTDPSTMNNDFGNFAHVGGSTPELAHSLFNPHGKNYFSLLECSIRSATDESGCVHSTVADDIAIGGNVTLVPWDSNVPSGAYTSAKLVDLDPLNQTVSTIFGAVFRFGSSEWSIQGKFEPSGVRDAWFGRSPVAGDKGASATWQSILTDVQWEGDFSSSPVLQQLHKTSPDVLSIKMNMDSYEANQDSSEFTLGQLTGSIGSCSENEPRQFIAGRRLVPQIQAPPAADYKSMESEECRVPMDQWYWCAPGILDANRNRLTIDLGNSIRRKSYLGEPAVDTLHAAILPNDANGRRVHLGPVPTGGESFRSRASITQLELQPEQTTLLKDHRLGLFVQPDDERPVLAEDESGDYVNTDAVFARLNSGESVDVDVYATRFGQPLPDKVIEFSCETRDWTENANVPERPLFGPPASRKKIQGTTDRHGVAKIHIEAANEKIVGLPEGRIPLDSQVYFLQGPWKDSGGLGWRLWNTTQIPVDGSPPVVIGGGQQGGGVISVLVFNTTTVPDKPDWTRDVEPILRLYAGLYPAMNSRIDLTDEHVLRQYAQILHLFMKLPFNHPGYMPLTRDLSKNRAAIVTRGLEQVSKEQTGKPLSANND